MENRHQIFVQGAYKLNLFIIITDNQVIMIACSSIHLYSKRVTKEKKRESNGDSINVYETFYDPVKVTIIKFWKAQLSHCP